jgi:cell division septation protein DedD
LYNNMGVSHGLMGDHEAAVAAFRKALVCGPASRKIYNNLGLTLAKMGRYDEAWEAFALGGGEAEAHNNLGCVLLYRGEHEKARRSFEKALEASPTFYPRAVNNLEWAQRSLENKASADPSIPIEAGPSSFLDDDGSETPPREDTASQGVAEKITEGDAEKEPAGFAAEPPAEPPAEPETRRDETRQVGKAVVSRPTRVDASASVKDGSESAGAVEVMGENSLGQKEDRPEETPDSFDVVTAEAVVGKPEFPASQGIYTIQVATFVEKTAAEQYVAELKRQNLNAFQWEIYLPKQGARHRICIGNFNTLEEAQGIARDLQERGLDASVAKLPVANVS